MSQLVSLDVIKHQLAGRIDSLVPMLFPAAARDGKEWRLGSISGEPGQSLAICRAGNRLGWWKDFCSGEGGDVLALVHAALNHRDYAETIRWCRNYLGLGVALSREEISRRERAAEQAQAEAARADRDQRQRAARAAKARFIEAQGLGGTPAERYLQGRHINFARLGRYPGALRYHAAMKCPETGRDRPCLLAAMQRPDGELVTIHRTFLLCHADGRVTKADRKSGGDMADAKQAYSGYAGAFIPVWRGKSEKPMRKMPVGEWIAITEGVEDALTVAMARPDLRVLAALSLSNLGGLALPERAAGIYLCADNDAKDAAIRAFQAAKAKLEARGFAVREVRPPAQFKDFNAWAEALAATGLADQSGAA